MASKIFAGDMPELVENILKNLNNDTYSLYSCALPEIINSLRQNEQFLSRIQYLSLSLVEKSEISTKIVSTLLKILEKTPMKLNALQINYDYREFTVSSGENPKKFHGIAIIGTLKRFDHNRISTFELVDRQIDASEMWIIFEKSGTSLQRLKLESTDVFIIEQSSLLGALKSFCPNITFLDISSIETSIQFLDLIGNLQKLQFLTLWCFWSIDEKPNEKQIIQLVIQLARTLPLTLQYLDLQNSRLNPYIGILLKNCNAPLKQL
ncbi:hypothetical protein F8M41_003872 [Gigaspora margarita]|uniref:Uncharacterized protein n=1 Tax=Gigaspora margarita TaxID=4874 RepID=A0A8H3XAL9_GIGMA|nr:hypothetical protein F8M41_003872 [Gigaspora margarita]